MILSLKKFKIAVCGIILAATAMLCACSGKGSKQSPPSSETGKEKLSTIPLPSVPDSLVLPEERAAYALSHYWDELPRMSRQLRLDTAFMEQSFSNFIALMPYVSTDRQNQAVAALLERVRRDSDEISLISFLAWKYLDEPNSPMRSEELYTVFLQQFCDTDDIPEEISLRSRERLKSALKNRPGTRAADIPLLTRDGRRTSLHTLAESDTLLVIFYDPDCEHCHRLIEHLAKATESASSPEITCKVLAIDVIPDNQLWNDSKSSMPRNWQVAHATIPVEDRELYTFPALPSLYLLAPGAQVILKDFTPSF